MLCLFAPSQSGLRGASHAAGDTFMPLTEWNEDVQRQIVEKYPSLEGKSEGILFCAAALEDEPDLRLNDMREKGRLFAPELTFSPVSITSAQVAMGRREKKARKARRRRTEVESEDVAPSFGGAMGSGMSSGLGSGMGSGMGGGMGGGLGERPSSGRMAKIERKLGNALSVLDQFDQARRQYQDLKSRIEQLNPSVLALLAELDESAREILQNEGLLQPEGDEGREDHDEGGERQAGGLY
jgi:hypothetical protein